jgi:hypothetical protein
MSLEFIKVTSNVTELETDQQFAALISSEGSWWWEGVC